MTIGNLRLRPIFRRKTSRLSLAVFFLVILYDSYWVLRGIRNSNRVPPTASPKRERIFIAGIHWNNEQILRTHWNQAVIDLVTHLGPGNVFVSILESGSWDDSKGALRDLDNQLAALGVQRSMVLDNATHKSEVSRLPSYKERGWIWTTRGRKELRRIPYLASLRNKVMQEMSVSSARGLEPFDKVLWLNDVVFTSEDITTLLATNEGEYAAVCALDFARPPSYYDTFALRDSKGAKTATQTWPYFSIGESQRRMISGKPVPVQSCWNGVVVMDAQPFYGQNPLQFRGLEDSLAEMHLEASECCLIHSDNPVSTVKGVWLNPNVRVAYSIDAYQEVNNGSSWPRAYRRIEGVWKARLASVLAIFMRKAEDWVVSGRMRRWRTDSALNVETSAEAGLHCIINEMQVLVENGWKHL